MLDFDGLNITIEVRDAAVVMAVRGEIDMLSAPTIAEALEQIDPHLELNVDCNAVSFMDSSGVNVLLRRSQQASRAGGCVRVIHPSIPVYRVLETAGLTTLIHTDSEPQNHV
jgi:anti-anti-sigma factor